MHYFSNRAQIALVALVFLFGLIHGNNWEPCGDWIQYNDEKCFKIIDDTLRTFDEAKDACATQQHTSTLAVIRSSEEQKFLSNYLFKTEQKVENFWIGAKYSSQNASFVWIDESQLNYTNWDAGHSPQSRANNCVHLQADEPVVGKWRSGRCVKKNAVVCQRMQFWSTEFLQKKFLDSRKQQMDAFDKIWSLTQNLSSANQRISSFGNVDQRIKKLKENFADVKKQIDELKQNFESANLIINEQKQSIETANLKNLIPIGFVYTQLPNEKEPSEMWPWMTWEDISYLYAGYFIRVLGGGSEKFGKTQIENTQRLESIYTVEGLCSNYNNNNGAVFAVNIPSAYSQGEKEKMHCHKFVISNEENRPENIAIKIWKRIE